jgi:CRISPR-associated protein Csm3
MSRLSKKILIQGKLEAVTGLMIGATNSAFSIGGPDKQVVRNPVTKLPYVPGSSLKGKIRSLIELRDGTISEKNQATNDPTTAAAKLFGFTQSKGPQQPSRLIVRDGQLINGNELNDTDLLYTEWKSENSINRITSEANPRTFERVPKGALFQLDLVLNVMDSDSNSGKDLLKTLWESLMLLQDDYLGGGGSRGNGQVKVKVDAVIERTGDFYSGKISEDRNITNDCGLPEELR